MYKGKIPFTRDGRLMNYASEYSSLDKPHEWKDNHEFEATLTFQGFERGRSAAHGVFKNAEGHRFVVFLKDVDTLITSGAMRTGGIVSGTWCYCKRGQNYGVQLVKPKTSKKKPWKWEQTTKNHWRADHGDDAMTVWESTGGTWSWEVWLHPLEDDPDIAGKAESFGEAKQKAEKALEDERARA
jgi:hypothetical protein